MCSFTKYMFVSFFVFILFIKEFSSRDLHASPRLMSRLVILPCVSDIECRTFINGTCVGEYCKCNGSNICVERRRVLVNKLGESCDTSEDCINIDNSECNGDKQCACRANSVPSSDERNCLEISKGVGDSCEEDIQCQSRTPHSECQENKCVCRQHMHEYKGACYRNVGFGEMCMESQECSHMKHSICKNNICSCADGHIGNSDECIAVSKGINSTCTKDIQCVAVLGIGSQCANEKCTCNELFHYKQSQKKCMRDLLLGDLCSFHSDCHQPGQEENRLECFIGNCICRVPYIEEGGYCINSATYATSLGILSIFFCFMLLIILP